MNGLKWLLLGAALAIASGASGAAEPSTSGQSAEEIVRMQRALRAKLESPTGEYARFSPEAISKMERAQDKVFQMLEGKSLDQLNDYEKTDLSNALDQIKATLLANDGNRQICHRERRTGTNLVSLRCETMAEREARARESNDAMRDISRTMQTTNGG